MSMARCIEPEWLDRLPADDPRAVRSRRDLRRINALMMNTGIVARKLARCFNQRQPCRIAELGAGDGSLMLALAQRFAARWKNVDLVLLDQQDIVSTATLEKFSRLDWRARVVKADVFEWLAQPADGAFDVIVANLFLHHFDAAALRALLALAAQRTQVLIASEPRRSAVALAGSHLLGFIGCNDVSRHDAVVSVHAGFSGRELSALWPAAPAWRLQEQVDGLFSHSFVATRVDGVNDLLGEGRT